MWDGWRLVSEINGLTGAAIAEYIPGPDYVDDIVASRRDLDNNGTFAADEVFYHQTNHQHSTTALLDHNGEVAERYSYDPFGVPTVHNATGDPIAQSAYGNNRLYTGLPWLPDLGLYDNRQRLYNPNTGRFLTQDPVHDPANLGNPYTYVGNNPGAYVDPYGLSMELANPGWSFWTGSFFTAFFESHASPTTAPKADTDPFRLLSKFEYRAARGDNTRGLGDAQHAAREAWDSGRQAVEWGTTPGSMVPIVGAIAGSANAAKDIGEGNWTGAAINGLGVAAGIRPFGSAADDLVGGSRGVIANSDNAMVKFRSFSAFKRAHGPAGEGKAWHHIVEQSQEGRFGAEAIHNAENIVAISSNTNIRLNALYSSIRLDITGSNKITVRQWLASKSYAEARAFGERALQNVQEGTWP